MNGCTRNGLPRKVISVHEFVCPVITKHTVSFLERIVAKDEYQRNQVGLSQILPPGVPENIEI